MWNTATLKNTLDIEVEANRNVSHEEFFGTTPEEVKATRDALYEQNHTAGGVLACGGSDCRGSGTGDEPVQREGRGGDAAPVGWS